MEQSGENVTEIDPAFFGDVLYITHRTVELAGMQPHLLSLQDTSPDVKGFTAMMDIKSINTFSSLFYSSKLQKVV